MRDFELEYILKNSKSLAGKLFKKYLNRDVFKVAATIKLNGYEKEERRAKKPIHVQGTSEKIMDGVMEKYENAQRFTELEKALSKQIGLDDGDVLVARRL